MFIHTILYNSEFRSRIYDIKDEYRSCMRMTTWEEPHNQYHLEDVEMLIKSERLFARKFDGDDGLETIKKIKRERERYL